MTNFHAKQFSSVENFILLCLDENFHQTQDEYQPSLHLFQSLINTIKFSSNLHEFRQWIDKTIDEKLFLIISGHFGEKLAAELENQPQILAIYIYSPQRQQHEIWTKDFRKIKGIYRDLRSISNAFRRDIRQATNDLISINILSTKTSNPSFLSSFLLKDIFLHSRSNDQMKQDLIDYARIHYSNNSIQLDLIDEYERDHSKQISAIEWYTRECFLSSMIHRAFRLYDINILNKITGFIQELNQQIEDMYRQSPSKEKLIVYYGQGISNTQFEMIEMNVNGLISFNSFLLTTIDQELSQKFAQQSGHQEKLLSVLFQIEIDRSKCSFPWIVLDQFDYYHDTDQYILFSFNPICRILNIERLEEKFWQINLVLIDQNDDQLKECRQSKGFFSLGQQMFKMNHFNQAKIIFDVLLQKTNDNPPQELVSIHSMLGRIDQTMGDLASALSHYQERLKTQLSYLSSDDPSLSMSFASIGAISEKLGHLNQALDYFQRAIKNQHHARRVDPYLMAFYYLSIGRILYKQGENSAARKNLEYALKCEQKSGISPGRFLVEIQHYLTILA